MRAVIFVLSALLISGCSVMPKSVIQDIDRNITLDQVQSNPERYTGQKVLWGGTVLGVENLENTTEIEVLETELSYDESPSDGDSRGRFIIEAKGFLDSNVYSKNRRVTVAGTVKGVETRKIGKMDYPFPVITPIEMRVMDPLPELPSYYDHPYMYRPYYPYYPFGPIYPYSPYYYPYYPFGRYRHPFYPPYYPYWP